VAGAQFAAGDGGDGGQVVGRIAETDGRIAELRAFSAHLTGVHADLSGPAPSGACGPDCGCTTTGPAAAAGPVPITLSPTRLSAESEPWRDAPVACTLGATRLGERTEQWRRLVGEAKGREEIPDGVRLIFPAGAEPAGEVAALAAAEQGCCAFFDFTLHLTPTALHLEVRAPESAAGMLADLFGATT
ncbi:heavy metal-responsive transcriptional regulator, partial [Streptomyces sp. NPDC005070]